MSNFHIAINTVLRHEGCFADDPDDPGGVTKYGISLRYLQSIGDIDGDGILEGDIDRDGDVDENDIRDLSENDAVALYRKQWWDRYAYDRIVHSIISTKIFDLAVNMGAKQTHKCVQRALRAIGYLTIKDDGILGPITLEAINECMSETTRMMLLVGIRCEAAGVYRQIVARTPSSAKFLNGWLNRAYD